MKAGSRRRHRSRRTKSPWFILGAMLGTVPQLHAAGRPATPALPIEHRIKLDPRQIESALAHVRIFTPSETASPDVLRHLDAEFHQLSVPPSSVPDGSEADNEVALAGGQRAPLFRFAIAPGPLASALAEFQTVTGLTIRAAEDVVRHLTTDGVSGTYTAARALELLLAGSSLSHRRIDATTFAIEVRLAAAVVDVTGGLPRVESPKYSAPLSETPQTIQVIPRTLLEEQGATSLTDALRNVPGITLQAGEGGGASNTSGDMFNMRGFSANNSIFVDNVRDDGMLTRDVFNLEQVEVYSGPTGSDVGRTNAAGYINLATKSPNREAGRSASLTYGDGEQVRATFDVNQPFALGARGTFLGEAAVRVNVLWQDGGVPGRDYAERGSKAIAPSIGFGLGTPTRATLSAQVMRQDNLADYGLPAAASPIGQLAPNAPLAAAPVNQANYYGSPDYDYDHGRQDNVTLRLEHDVSSSVTLRNQTRYNTTTREAVITSIQNPAAYDPATNRVSLSRQANERHNDIFSNQTNLSARLATGRLQHQLSVGLEVARESQFAPALGGVGTRAPIDLNYPDVFSPVIGMNIAPTGALAEGSTDTVAVYAFDAFDVTPRVRVNGGVRVERYDTSSHSVAASGLVTDLDGEDTLVSGKAGVIFDLTGSGNLYASYGSSVTPPGAANFQLNAAPTNPNNPNVDPQESTNYEVGTKWDLAGGRLQLNGAYFWTRNKNVIFVVDAAAVPPIFNQDDGQRVNGIVIGAVGQITPRLDVNFSVQYLDSTVESQNPAIDGNRLALTPELSGNVWASYRLPHDIRVGGGLRYTDPVFINTANTTAVPRYSVVDALVEAPLGDRLTLRLNLYNLTDRVYIRNINNNAGRYNPGTPRTFLLSSAIRF